jgi:hypothetical protein
MALARVWKDGQSRISYCVRTKYDLSNALELQRNCYVVAN